VLSVKTFVIRDVEPNVLIAACIIITSVGELANGEKWSEDMIGINFIIFTAAGMCAIFRVLDCDWIIGSPLGKTFNS